MIYAAAVVVAVCASVVTHQDREFGSISAFAVILWILAGLLVVAGVTS